MQTFLPYPSFQKSLECLDNKRLGKQRVEAMQLINALEKGSGAWFNHPACQMWKGYEIALKIYHDCSLMIWAERGFNNVKLRPYFNYLETFSMKRPIPEWFGNPDFHASHRSNLLRKDPVHYGQFGWKEPDDLPYVWPSNTKEVV